MYLSDVDFVPNMGLHENLKDRINEGLLENKTVWFFKEFFHFQFHVVFYDDSENIFMFNNTTSK